MRINTLKFLLPAFIAAMAFGTTAASATCTATGFVRDSIDLTAALINPSGTVHGDVDATGCNIGIYYSSGKHGNVNNANVHGANYYGIVNDGASVDIKNSTVSDIGERPFNGTQHGVAVYFAFGSNARGDIVNNTVYNYQKGGIVVNGPNARSQISRNTVIGLGPVNFIAQNGIQAGYGADTSIENNFVSGNSYTGGNFAASGGILLVGGACYGGDPTVKTNIANNNVFGNDVGVWLSNLDGSCAPLSTPTKNNVVSNSLVNNGVNNTTGTSATQGYQAGIADQGDFDSIINNDTCGPGYTPPGDASAVLFAIDVTATNNPKVSHNTVCSDHGSWWSFSAQTQRAARGKGRRASAKPVK